MPKRSNSFNCVLNDNYKKALNFTIATSYKDPSNRDEHDPDWFYDDDDYLYEGSTQCCGIDELNFQSIIGAITKVSQTTKHLVAKHIKRYAKDDRRILIVGLPLRSSDGHNSQYDFANYQRLRRILLGFGFKQTHERPYKNTNSNNMLSVLVGQFPK